MSHAQRAGLWAVLLFAASRSALAADAKTPVLTSLTDAATYTVANVYHSTLLGGSSIPGIAPGEIVSLFGDGLGPDRGETPQVTMATGFPEALAGVQVLFDGQPAPLLYVQNPQINAVAPWRLVPATTTEVCVVYNDVKSNCLLEPVSQAAPAVFRAADVGFAAAVNQDGTINSAENPAVPGSLISVFATGFGTLHPVQSDGAIIGLPLPFNDLSVAAYLVRMSGIGGIGLLPLEVAYAGPAPFQVAGVTQVNLRVPSTGSPTVYAPPLALLAGGANDWFEVYVRDALPGVQ